MKRKWLYQKIFLVAAIIILIANNGNSQHQVSPGIFSSGGMTHNNSNYTLSGTIGEIVTGTTSGSLNQKQVGFWYAYSQSILTDVENDEMIPATFKMEQNYPNPFNPSTVIRFAVSENINVTLKVYDILGGEVTTLLNEDKDAGWYNISFDASGLASGIYIYRITAGSFISTKKMLLLK